MSALELLTRAHDRAVEAEEWVPVRARPSQAVQGESLMPEEHAAFASIVNSVFDDEDYGDAFRFVD